MPATAHRGEIVHLTDDPARSANALQHISDGLLVIRDGRIEALGAYGHLAPAIVGQTEIVDHRGGLITPGFVDCHVHYPQVDVIASHGAQLMDWLERHTFPVEARFSDGAVARETAGFFLSELLRNGVTTALVFSTIHTGATAALFEAAHARTMRVITGKTFMDRGAPEDVCEGVEEARDGALMLIEAWRGVGRLAYAVTPRFAPTCSPDMLAMAGELLVSHDGLYLHTHLSENADEIAEVALLYPDARDYLGVYESHGLVTDRSVFAHCIHLDRGGFERLAAAGAAIAHCPTSNLFLGSGLFDLDLAREAGVTVGIGSDVGGGTSFSPFETLEEAYKVAQLRGGELTPLSAFYLATRGGARALGLEAKVGGLSSGMDADFLVLDRAATPLLERRIARCDTIADELFALMILGDDRAVARTYVAGALAHARDASLSSQAP